MAMLSLPSLSLHFPTAAGGSVAMQHAAVIVVLFLDLFLPHSSNVSLALVFLFLPSLLIYIYIISCLLLVVAFPPIFVIPPSFAFALLIAGVHFSVTSNKDTTSDTTPLYLNFNTQQEGAAIEEHGGLLPAHPSLWVSCWVFLIFDAIFQLARR